MKICERCIFLLLIITGIYSSSVAEVDHLSLETHEFDLLDGDLLEEHDFVQLTRRFRHLNIRELESAFESLFTEDDWVWTFMTYSDDVRRTWVNQLSSYMTTSGSSRHMKRKWSLHCIDAHAMCQINTECSDLYSDVIDACHLNRARIFGQADSPEALAFAAKQATIKAAVRASQRLRKRKCRAYFKRRMARQSRPRGPLLIGRSVISRQSKLVAGLKEWIRARRRRKMKMTSRRHVATMGEVMGRMRYWAGRTHNAVHALVCENLEETCPATCFDAVKRLNASAYAPLLHNCNCAFTELPRNLSNRVGALGFSRPTNLWDEATCTVQKRLVDACRPKVYRSLPARRPGCTVVLVKCRANRACFRAYREVLVNCAGAIEGRKCPLNCTAAMAGLYARAPSFHRCRPDGLKRPQWMKWQRSMGRGCNLTCAAQSAGRDDALTKC